KTTLYHWMLLKILLLFRMVSKLKMIEFGMFPCFRAVLFRMVSKLLGCLAISAPRFRAVLFRMVSKYTYDIFGNVF
ncbi:TPA: hypothetical protein ACGO7L_002075, partial [Streptococcus suis]